LPALLYRFDPQDGGLRVMEDDFVGPNSLAFSPDERLLYVAETGNQFDANPTRHIRVFDVQDGGRRLSGGRVFHTTSPGYADGCRVDEDGNVWSSAGNGVHGIAPDGSKLGVIKVPFTVSNLTFCGRKPVPAIYLRVPHPVCDLHQPTGCPAALKPQGAPGPSLVKPRRTRSQPEWRREQGTAKRRASCARRQSWSARLRSPKGRRDTGLEHRRSPR